MKNYLALWVCLMAFQFSFGQDSTAAQQPPVQKPVVKKAAPVAQPATPVVTQSTDENYTLRERFGIMKAKAQSYREYKVIKESVLDGVWKITRDSILAKDQALREAKQSIAKLNGEVSQIQQTLKQKEESMEETMHASTHIAVLGIDIPKGVFLTIVACVIGALAFVIATAFGRMKLLTKSLQEKKLAVNLITTEYDEYKRKAMEKQTKLSRELQDERNRLAAFRNS